VVEYFFPEAGLGPSVRVQVQMPVPPKKKKNPQKPKKPLHLSYVNIRGKKHVK
jgi:hypothetical protein